MKTNMKTIQRIAYHSFTCVRWDLLLLRSFRVGFIIYKRFDSSTLNLLGWILFCFVSQIEPFKSSKANKLGKRCLRREFGCSVGDSSKLWLFSRILRSFRTFLLYRDLPESNNRSWFQIFRFTFYNFAKFQHFQMNFDNPHENSACNIINK